MNHVDHLDSTELETRPGRPGVTSDMHSTMASAATQGHPDAKGNASQNGARPQSDTGTARRGFFLRVRDVREETAHARSIILDVPLEAAARFDHAPGQFLTIRIPEGDGHAATARCYSIASAPGLDENLMIGVKRVVGGRGSNWICDHVQPGDELEVLPPAGRFTPRSLDDDALLLAAGSGITPIISIARSVLERGTGSLVLVYANRSEAEVIYAERIRLLREKYPERLVVLHLLESLDGLPSSTGLARLLAPYSHLTAAYVCGPTPFMEAAEVALSTVGMDAGQIVLERFVSLEGNPFEATQSLPASDADESTSLTVTLDGETRTVPWPRSAILLDVLLNEGLDAPYSCREGACSACACRVLSGAAAMDRNEVLDADDLADGLILACQARSTGDQISITYD